VRKAILKFSLLTLILSVFAPVLGSTAHGQEEEDIRSIWVAHRRVDCIGVAPQKCYLIKSTQYEDWKFWYSDIEGFDFEEGYAYELLVREVHNDDAPADAPSVKLELVEVLLKVETFESNAGMQAPSPPPSAPAPAEPETVDVELAPAPPVQPPAEAVAPPPTSVVESPPPPPPSSVQPSPEPPAPKATPMPAEPGSETPPPTGAPPPAPVAATEPGPQAPTGQRIRGHLSIGAGIEARSFKLCGAEESIWVEDRTEEDLWGIYREMAGFPNRPVYMIVRGELQPSPPSGFGAHYSQQLLIFDLRHAATESAGCFDDLSRLEFRASGNEPFWSLEISQRGLAFSEMGQEGRTLFPYAAPSSTNGRLVYQSRTGGNTPRSIGVSLDERPCNDTMADARFSFSATVEIDGRVLNGCALEGGARP
jgi:uncharacterized membrane protein